MLRYSYCTSYARDVKEVNIDKTHVKSTTSVSAKQSEMFS